MAAKKISLIKLKIDLEGLKDFKGLTKQLTNLNTQLTPTKRNINSLKQSIEEVSKVQPKTISQFKQKEKILKRLREEVDIGGKAFKRLGREIEANRKKLNAFNATGKKGAGLGRQVGLGFASTIASQVLPGFTSQGALAGANLGGAKGALIGAGIGAGIDFAIFTRSATEYAAEVGRLRIALLGVTKDSKTYNKGLQIIRSVSDELNVPIAQATKQFTQLAASVLGSGGTIKDAETVFRGISEAIKATGGDAEDLSSGIRAMAQVFGKGKVSAEELQGQLGERLPGAVVKFAKANNRSMTQLQKDLRDGVVDLNQIINFANKLSTDHRKAALEMAASSEESGARMKNAFLDMKFEVGIIFKELGGEFNDLITGILRQITRLLRLINKIRNEQAAKAFANKKVQEAFGGNFNEQLGGMGFDSPFRLGDKRTNAQGETIQQMGQRIKDERLTQEIIDDFKPGKFPLFTSDKDKQEAAVKFRLELGLINKQEFENNLLRLEAKKAMEALPELAKELGLDLDGVVAKLKEARSDTFNFKEELAKVVKAGTDLQNNIEQLAVTSINKLADGFAELAVSGKASFGDLAKSILQDLQRMIIKALFFKTIFNLFPGLESFLGFEKGGVVKSAKGNVFAKNNVQPFYRGGVVDKPSIFPMARGVGLMAESGPEAILPLQRGRGGKLGVIAQGGGASNIVVNVDASGSSVEGNEDSGRQLGQLIATAVQSQLVEEKRPGGLLE